MTELTQEEKVILILLAQGFTAKEISTMFTDMPLRRIRKIKLRFVAKLGARNQMHAVYLAFKQKLIKL